MGDLSRKSAPGGCTRQVGSGNYLTHILWRVERFGCVAGLDDKESLIRRWIEYRRASVSDG
jgi:hypothetical protein